MNIFDAHEPSHSTVLHRWYPNDRPKMQSLGKMPELQAAKVAEVGAVSPHFARILVQIFT